MALVSSPRLHQSFIVVGGYRHAIVPVLLTAICGVAYAMQAPNVRPNGGTWLGLALGSVAALFIVVLMGYGIRRRVFGAAVGSATHWLSVHVYLGLSTLVIAALHCGFQFGWNIHSVLFALQFLVVASGCWGVYAYLRYPALLMSVRSEHSRAQLLSQMSAFDEQALAIAATLDAPVRELVIDAIRRTRIGGGLWAQLCARDASTLMFTPPIHSGIARLVPNGGQLTLIDILSRRLASAGTPDVKQSLERLLKITGSKSVVQNRLRRDLQLQGLMQFWLYLHLPLSFGLLTALVVHIFSVFFYR